LGLAAKWSAWGDLLTPGNLRLSKIANAARYVWARRYPSARASYLPLFYMIETGTACRLRCEFCFHGAPGTATLPNGFLTMETFRRILDQIRGSALILDLFKHGEPLLHPQLPEMIAVARREGVRCRVNTGLNATVEDDYARRLMGSGLLKLNCALDGTTQEVYARYRRGGSVALALGNAERLLRQARRGGPRVVWRMLVFEWNQHQVEEARRQARERGFDAFEAASGVYWNEGRTVEWDIERGGWRPTAWHRASVGLEPEGRPEKSPSPCRSLLAHGVIHSDGRLAPCCHASRGEWLEGSVIADGLSPIWNSGPHAHTRAYTLGLHTKRDGVLAACESCPWL
jgi:MoaA/NifB/PqqE/SkfB family radical SAM enzyme